MIVCEKVVPNCLFAMSSSSPATRRSSPLSPVSMIMSPTTPRRGIRRQNAVMFSPEKSASVSPGTDSVASRLRNLAMSPKTPPMKKTPSTSSPGSSPPSSGRTLKLGGKPMNKAASSRGSVMKKSTSSSPSSTTSASSKKGMGGVMKAMKKQILKSMKSIIMGKGKKKAATKTQKERKAVKKDAILKPKSNKFGWVPTSDANFVFPKNSFKEWTAAPGQVKMLHQDLCDAWQEHRETLSYNKSHGCSTEALKTFLGNANSSESSECSNDHFFTDRKLKL